MSWSRGVKAGHRRWRRGRHLFKLNYLAPVRSGVVRADSRVVGMSSRTAVVHVDVTNGERPVAVALGTISLNPTR